MGYPRRCDGRRQSHGSLSAFVSRWIPRGKTLIRVIRHSQANLRAVAFRLLRGAVSVMPSASLFACAHGHTGAAASPAASGIAEPQSHEVRIGAGLACSVTGHVGSPSFAVHDIGRSGVPSVNATELAMIRSIMRYVHPSTLRFARVPQFIVFDAQYGMCPGAPHEVLNAVACTMVYQPSDEHSGPFAAPGGCCNHPRPWIPRDHGTLSAPAWTTYDNNH